MNTTDLRYWGTMGVILVAVFLWKGGDLFRGLADLAAVLLGKGK